MNKFPTALVAGAAILAALAVPVVGASAASAADAFFAPIANDDEYFMMQGESMVVGGTGVIANDTNSDSGDLLINGMDAAFPGEIFGLGSAGFFTFVPDPSFVGDRIITYTIKDTLSGFISNTATVVIHVAAAPAPLPVANPDSYSTPQDTPLLIDAPAGLLANDVSAYQVNFQDDATGEVLVNAAGDFTYTPAPGFVGTKTFSYTMTDGTNTSNVALVTIEVTAPITIIPSNPIPHDSAIPGGTTTDDGQLETLAYTGAEDVTAWLIAPAAVLLALGGLGVWFARRRSAQQ